MSTRLKRQVIRAVPWSVAESLVNGFAGLALTFILAWFLSPMEVGQATIALAVVGVAEIIAGLGMVEALIGAKSGHTRASDTAFTVLVVLGLVAAGVCWSLAGLVGHFYNEPLTAQLLEVAALILPINALVAIPTGLLIRKMRAAALTLRMMTSRVVTIVATAVFAYLSFGAWSLVLGNLAGSCAALLVLAPAMARWPRLRFSWQEFRKLVVFGAAFSIERLLWGLMIRAFWLVVGYVHGPVTLGYFQFGQRLIDETANLVQTFSLRFGLAFFGALERVGRNPTDAFLKATRLITVVATPVFVGLALIIPDVIGTIFDAKWAPAAIVGQVAAIGWVIAFPRALVGVVLRARGRQGSLVLYAVVACVATISAGLLTGGQSLFVVALAWIPRHLIGVVWSYYVINRYLHISPKDQIVASIRPVFAALLMAVVVIGSNVLLQDFAPIERLCLEIVIGATTYATVLALIDRATLNLLLGIFTDMRQLKGSV